MKPGMLSSVHSADDICIAENKTRSPSGPGRRAMRRRVRAGVVSDDNSGQDAAAHKNRYREASSQRANA
jgi:hypothetical protein